MSPHALRTAAVLLLALERLPRSTSGISASLAFLSDNTNGNYGWASIEFCEKEFELGTGEHFYSCAVGGDTQSRTVFETQVGTSLRNGNIEDWLETAQFLAKHERLSVDDNSTHDAIEWDCD